VYLVGRKERPWRRICRRRVIHFENLAREATLFGKKHRGEEWGGR
jgi:hypothetical protein